LEDYVTALDVFKGVSLMDKRYVKACYYWGLTLIHLERLEEAEKIWLEGMANNP
jgi:hypothetical protein